MSEVPKLTFADAPTSALDLSVIRDGSFDASPYRGQEECPTTVLSAVPASAAYEAPTTHLPPQPPVSPSSVPEAVSIFPEKEWFEFWKQGRLIGGYRDRRTREPDGVWELHPANREVIATIKPPKNDEKTSDDDYEFHISSKGGKLDGSFGGHTESIEEHILYQARRILDKRFPHGLAGAPPQAPPALPPAQQHVSPPPSTPADPRANEGIGGLQFTKDETRNEGAVHARVSSAEKTKKVGSMAWRNRRLIASIATVLIGVAIADPMYAKVRGGGKQLIDMNAAVHGKDPFHDPLHDATAVPCKFLPFC